MISSGATSHNRRHHPPGLYELVVVALEALGGQGIEGLNAADHWTCQRVLTPSGSEKGLLDPLRRVVRDQIELSSRHPAFQLDVFRREGRAEDGVDQEVEGVVERIDCGVDTDPHHLGAGPGVDLTAKAVDRQRQRAPVVGATGAQGEVLDKVGGASKVFRVMRRAAGDPDTGSHGLPTG